MPSKIFYAWQSDRNQYVCHYFVRDALKMAIKRIVKGSDGDTVLQEAFRPELDHDRKGVPGTPRIAETIEKKIRKAAVFVADLSFVTNFITEDQRNKRTPNANVLIELGMAFRAVKSERIILVMNTAFGSHNDLPFDLQDRSHPIAFNVASDSDPEYKAKLAKLADDFVGPLKSSLAYYSELQNQKALAAESAMSVAVALDRKQAWDSFRGLVVGGGFHGVPKGPGIGIMIMPVRPLKQVLNLDSIDDNGVWRLLSPIGADGWNHDLHGTFYMTHDGRNTKPGRPAVEPTAATSVMQNGKIFAFQGIYVSPADGDEGRVCVIQEKICRTIHKASSYIYALRQLGVIGELEVRILVCGISGTKLLPSNHRNYDERQFRPLAYDVYESDPVQLPADFDGRDTSGLATALRPATEHLWRDAGVRYDPQFEQNGQYRLNCE